MMARGSRRIFLVGALLTPLALAGCGGEQVSSAAPPDIAYNRDTCDRCGMLIADERYAAGLVAADGTAQLFDDIGEMVQLVKEEGSNERRAWVHDWHSGEWIDAATAFYVQGDKAMTPMGTGVIAFGAREDAENYVAEQPAPILGWDDLTGSQV